MFCRGYHTTPLVPFWIALRRVTGPPQQCVRKSPFFTLRFTTLTSSLNNAASKPRDSSTTSKIVSRSDRNSLTSHTHPERFSNLEFWSGVIGVCLIAYATYNYVLEQHQASLQPSDDSTSESSSSSVSPSDSPSNSSDTSLPTQDPLPAQDTDLSSVYDSTASHFDVDVSFVESWSGIEKQRKRLVGRCIGHVLEVGVGTGRNVGYFLIYGQKRAQEDGKTEDEKPPVESVTFIDQSEPMIEVAQKKWRILHPYYTRADFRVQDGTKGDIAPPACTNGNSSTDADLSPNSKPSRWLRKTKSASASTSSTTFAGFTTLLSTFTLCSLPNPASSLRHLSTSLDPKDGRVLLLEHGRSDWDLVNWMLDRSAAKHALKHGCWWNRDIGKIVEESGLVVERIERKQFGTLWVVEARVKRDGE